MGLFVPSFFPFIYWQGKDGCSFMKFRAVFFLERIDSRGVNDLRCDVFLIFFSSENFASKQINKEVGAEANP